jgi:hypothetical protein
MDLETYRIKQEKIRKLEDIEQEAMLRRNQPIQKASIAFLRDTDEPVEPAAQVENPQPIEPKQVEQAEQQAETHKRDNRPRKSKNTKKTK